ncbi:hypothetical protein KPH14_011619 [Odynerus spinipes]|uniref:FP protein C-terminal domain-containing protein n=1 Tax=Odynerus spinipes TaxID=1348599 RepID=A0AAD9RGE1_9HYME|nr:hypothetical protein KPH14_011619 [Odynerus spinipes]
MSPCRGCRMCNKPIANESVYCVGCSKFYHPGCVKKRTNQTGTTYCCRDIRMEYLLQGVEPVAHPSPRRPSRSRSRHNSLFMTPPQQLQSTSNTSSQSVTEACDYISNAELLRSLNERFDQILAQISGLSAMQSHIESNTVRIAELEDCNRALRNDIAALQRQLDRDQLERRRASVRQGTTDLIISGVPCQTSGELLATVKGVLAAIDITLTDNDIKQIRFLKVLTAKRTKGRLLTSDLAFVTTSDRPAPVYVNEALPSELYQLFLAAKTAARSLSYKYIWHRDGTIFLRRSDGEKVERIHSLTQLRDFEERCSSGTALAKQTATNIRHSEVISSPGPLAGQHHHQSS